MAVTAEQIEAQLAPLREELARAQQPSPHEDLSGGLSDLELRKIRIRCEAAIERLAPKGSVYPHDAHNLGKMWDGKRIQTLIGILEALQADYASGWLRSVEELLHADLFGDFLGMADELLDKGYKDAAAVITGSVLEEHLRKLAASVGVEIENDEGKPRKADALNADLAKEETYSKLEQKSVTAWLGLRNHAAHGEYDKYDHRQVAALIRDVRDFLIRHPA